MKNNQTRQLVLAGLFLALALVLPWITMQIPTLGVLLTPMHFPVILAAVFLGPIYGGIIGLVAPLLRTLMFGLPPMPIAAFMSAELLTYAVVIGLIMIFLKEKNINFTLKIVIALVIAMLLGRIVYALTMNIFVNANFFAVFLTTFTGSFVGIILQLILIPLLATRLKQYAFTR